MQTIKILALSDVHNHLTQEQQALIDSYEDIDLVVTLGDMPIDKIRRVDYGVLGNHDTQIDAEKDLHLNTVSMKGYTLTGVRGCLRYIDGPELMYTQDEAKLLNIPKADILLSHDKCYDGSEKVHCGLQVLSEYVDKIKPRLHIHGHHHTNEIYQKGNTVCVSVYKCALVMVTPNSITVERLF